MPVNLNLRKRLSDSLGVNLNLRDIFGKFNRGNSEISDSDTLRKTKGKGIDDFKTNVTSFARPNLFEVVFSTRGNKLISSGLNKRLSFSCFQASIPSMSTLTTDKDEGYRSIAYQKAYEDVTLSFYVQEDMKEIKFFQDWMQMMIIPENNRVGFYDDYTSTVEIKNLDRNENKPILTTILHDAYPKTLSAIDLNYDSADIMRVSIVMTYRYYTQEYGGKQESVGRSESLRHYENNMEEVDADSVQINQVLDKTMELTKNKQGFYVPKESRINQ